MFYLFMFNYSLVCTVHGNLLFLKNLSKNCSIVLIEIVCFLVFTIQMIGILNDMIFNLHLIPLDRLLTSLVLHPTDDGATEIAMLIIHSLVYLFCVSVSDLLSFLEFVKKKILCNQRKIEL